MTEESITGSVTPEDASMVCDLARFHGARYLTGQDLRRARRLAEVGLLEQGKLGDRYFGVTKAGTTFARNVQDHRNAS